jgi:hypothetical protein
MFKVTTYYTPDDMAVQKYKSAASNLWTDHVFYTRNAVISLLSNLGDIKEITDRLMKNQEQLGSMLRPYYDSAQVDHLVELMQVHVTMAVEIITAAQNNQNTKDLITLWRSHSDQIIMSFLEMNPHWGQSTLAQLWNDHLTQTLNQVQYRLDKNWSSDVMNFDNIVSNARMIAESISDGVVQQNKIKFCTLSNGGSHELTV